MTREAHPDFQSGVEGGSRCGSEQLPLPHCGCNDSVPMSSPTSSRGDIAETERDADGRVILHPGDEVWFLTAEVSGTRSDSGTRKTLTGAAFGRVIAVDGDRVTAEVLRSAGFRAVMVGRHYTEHRSWFYARKDRAEHNAFGAEVHRFYGDRSHAR